MKRLLLIEDSKVDAMKAQAAIESESPEEFEFVVCQTIEAALRKLDSETFDVISLDLNLPDAEGLTGLMRLKEHARNIPLVVMTGQNEPELALEAIALGAQDFITKGIFSYGNLLARVFIHAIERKKLNNLILQTLEIEHKVLSDALRQSQLLVVRMDQELKILFANDSFINRVCIGSQMRDLVGMHVSDVLPGLDFEPLQEAMSRKSQMQLKEIRLSRILQKTEENIWVDVFFWPYLNLEGDGDAYMLLIVDVSDRLKAKLQRDEFVAALSHDVKNPLVGGQQVLTGVLSGTRDVLPSFYYDSLLSLSRSNQSLLLILSNLTDVYSLEAGEREFVFENANLVRLIDEVLDLFKHFFESTGMTIVKHDFPNSLVIKLDVTAFFRIFSNLLHNVWKFGKKGSQVNIYFESDANNFQIAVESTGAPIKEEDKAILFKRFKRSLLGQEHLHSSGLGLYLCKKLVEGHSGSIECISDGDVTKLVVKLPRISDDT
ncbi:response regulator [bacterium]|nr:response regulator [bacterium]QQR58928.1 MAG: response regulator [Candidatus Melainabacteria bacterium]